MVFRQSCDYAGGDCFPCLRRGRLCFAPRKDIPGYRMSLRAQRGNLLATVVELAKGALSCLPLFGGMLT